jgi:hypothetical protein
MMILDERHLPLLMFVMCCLHRLRDVARAQPVATSSIDQQVHAAVPRQQSCNCYVECTASLLARGEVALVSKIHPLPSRSSDRCIASDGLAVAMCTSVDTSKGNLLDLASKVGQVLLKASASCISRQTSALRSSSITVQHTTGSG